MKPLIRCILTLPPVLLSFVSGARASDFLYVNNNISPNTVSGYSVSAAGALTPIIGSPYQTGGHGSGFGAFVANRLVVRGSLLFASNSFSGDISVFAVKAIDGSLTPTPGSPFPAGFIDGNGISLAVTPDGRYLYAMGVATGAFSLFSISAGGSLIAILNPFASPKPAFLGFEPIGMKVSPDGKFISIALFQPSGLAMFSIGQDGRLTVVPGSPFSTSGAGTTSMEFNCPGNTLFVGEHSGLPTTDVFKIGLDGSLSPVAGSPFIQMSGNLGNSAQGVLLSPNGKFLFVSNQFSATVLAYSVGSGGGLTLVPGSAFPVGCAQCNPAGLAINTSGTILFVGVDSFGGSPLLEVFTVSSSGVLTPAAGSPLSTGEPNSSISIAAYPDATCSSGFDQCITDDVSGDHLQFSSMTGKYQFTRCKDGFTLSGSGSIRVVNSVLVLTDNRPDRKINAGFIQGQQTGRATIMLTVAPGVFQTISISGTIPGATCSCK